MKKIFLYILLLPLSISAQGKEKLTFDKLYEEVHTYLSNNDTIYIIQKKHQKVTKGSVLITGVHNKISTGEVINGVYVFSMNITDAKVYFLLVDNNKIIILDISNRENLNKSLVLLLDFCDKYKYCESIITDYVGGLTRVYYNLNKWKFERRDLNCEEGRGITDIKDLP
jgi:hypothetical protein